MVRNFGLAALAGAALLAGCAYDPGSLSVEQGTAYSEVTRDAWGNPVSATATVRDGVYYPVPAYQAPPTVVTTAPTVVTTAPAPSTVYYDAYGRPVGVAPGTVLYYPTR
jgi:hypothetical protein